MRKICARPAQTETQLGGGTRTLNSTSSSGATKKGRAIFSKNVVSSMGTMLEGMSTQSRLFGAAKVVLNALFYLLNFFLKDSKLGG